MLSDKAKTYKHHFLSISKWLLLILILYIIGKELYKSILLINWAMIKPRPYLIVLGSITVCISMLTGAVTTQIIYHWFHYRLSFLQAIILFITPPLGKYIPTKAMSLAGSIAIGKAFGIRVMVMGLGNLLFMGLGLSSMTLLGTSILFLKIPNIAPDYILLICTIVIGFTNLLLILYPSLFVFFINQGLRLIKQPPVNFILKPIEMMILFIGIFIQNSLCLCGFAIISLGCVELSLQILPALLAISCLANVSGFLALFAPAGIGVREGVFLTLLTPIIGLGSAGLITIILRFAQTLADLVFGLSGLFAYHCLRKYKRNS